MNGYDLTVVPVEVQGPFAVETNWDVLLNGKPIKGARHCTKAAAEAELQAFTAILKPSRGVHYGYFNH